MSEITNFPTYHQKENIVTNHTLFLLKRLYNYSSTKFQLFMSTLIEEEEGIYTKINFGQQEGNKSSIPDGVIQQESFKLLIETKTGSNFSVKQIERHLKSFENEDKKFILLLGKNIPSENKINEIENKVKEYMRKNEEEINIIGPKTFRDIIEIYRDTLEEYEIEMNEIIDDYEAFCEKKNLISIEKFRMRAIPCNTTKDLNLEENIYYMPADRGYKDHKYIGLYWDKSIRYIGEVIKSIVVDYDVKGDNPLKILEGTAKKKKKQKIKNIMKEAYEKFGHTFQSRHRIFFVDDFYKTNFKKTSKYGLRYVSYFDLRNYLINTVQADEPEDIKKLPSTKKVAEILAEQSWE